MRQRGYLGVLGALLALTSGCAGSSALESPAAGRTVIYEPGLPNFDAEAIASVQEGTTGLDVYTAIPYASLVFARQDSSFQAVFETFIRIRDEAGRSILQEVSVRDTLRLARFEATQDYAHYHRKHPLAVAPGVYGVEITVEDLGSQKRAQRQVRVQVPGPDAVALGRIRLEGRRPGQPFTPELALHLRAGLDSLRATVLLGAHARPLQLFLRVLRLPADTTVAPQPYWLQLSAGSLFYRGVRYNEADTLVAQRRDAPPQVSTTSQAFSLAGLPPGYYRMEVEALPVGVSSLRDNPLRQVREFAVRTPGFPRLTTLDDLVAALSYLTTRQEQAHLEEAPTPQEKRRRFDAFWGALVADRQTATNLFRQYYSRVEEANLLFTSFKEGWKTDRGMLYIVLGAPYFVESQVEEETWNYSYDEQNPLHRFVFERIRGFQSDTPFAHYVLERSPAYEQAWRRAVERWRRGESL
jgi:GWxTD domain-containing protein